MQWYYIPPNALIKCRNRLKGIFGTKERRANSVRKKSLDALNYITIPDTILNMKPLSMTEEIRDYLKDLKDLSALPIVNLTGISNTDLKLAYGTANITVLTEYDSHYTNMVTILQKLAQCLVDHNEKELATEVLEFAVSTGTDVSRTYYLWLLFIRRMDKRPGFVSLLLPPLPLIP